jgi:putative toxin-antitoxin system antitoxin component (TIGR02293 family)
VDLTDAGATAEAVRHVDRSIEGPGARDSTSSPHCVTITSTIGGTLHLLQAELEPLLALSEATMARRIREQGALDLAASERLDRLVQVISLAYEVFEQPASTEAWLKAPHPLLQALEQGAPV